MQRAAWILGMNPKTVARRVPYFAEKARRSLRANQTEREAVEEVCLDELITFEHTRCKPVAVAMAVSERREILGYRVSSMPPIGKHLKRISLKKYGKRPNHRARGIQGCLSDIRPRAIGAHFKTDEEPSYAPLIQRHFPGARHDAFPSKRAVIAGQGELKDHRYDPIFPINHTLAMLRANLSRLIRRTWCTTKKLHRLDDFLAIYAHAHNTLLINQTS